MSNITGFLENAFGIRDSGQLMASFALAAGVATMIGIFALDQIPNEKFEALFRPRRKDEKRLHHPPTPR